MSGTKKLQDLFVDEHVPREERGRVPLVVDGSTIVWVAGMRVDERYRVTPATTQAIRLRFEPT
jgi:tRNA(Ile)-lysidine synthase